jgi:hypothetical protein
MKPIKQLLKLETSQTWRLQFRKGSTKVNTPGKSCAKYDIATPKLAPELSPNT